MKCAWWGPFQHRISSWFCGVSANTHTRKETSYLVCARFAFPQPNPNKQTSHNHIHHQRHKPKLPTATKENTYNHTMRTTTILVALAVVLAIVAAQAQAVSAKTTCSRFKTCWECVCARSGYTTDNTCQTTSGCSWCPSTNSCTSLAALNNGTASADEGICPGRISPNADELLHNVDDDDEMSPAEMCELPMSTSAVLCLHSRQFSHLLFCLLLFTACRAWRHPGAVHLPWLRGHCRHLDNLLLHLPQLSGQEQAPGLELAGEHCAGAHTAWTEPRVARR